MASQAEENMQERNEAGDTSPETVDEKAKAGQPQPEADVAGQAVDGEAEAGESQDEAGVAEQSDDDPQALREALDSARQAAEDNWNKLMRLQAEMENLRKRTSRDVENAHKFALERFVSELLPVIDSLELGISAADASSSDDAAGLREGMELTLKKCLDVIGKFGVEQIDPMGEKFNPELHEAVSMQDSEAAEPNTVITVVQKGYTLNERLVRPAMVVVAK